MYIIIIWTCLRCSQAIIMSRMIFWNAGFLLTLLFLHFNSDSYFQKKTKRRRKTRTKAHIRSAPFRQTWFFLKKNLNETNSLSWIETTPTTTKRNYFFSSYDSCTFSTLIQWQSNENKKCRTILRDMMINMTSCRSDNVVVYSFVSFL